MYGNIAAVCRFGSFVQEVTKDSETLNANLFGQGLPLGSDCRCEKFMFGKLISEKANTRFEGLNFRGRSEHVGR